MIRKLQTKFVIINMTMVTVMLCVIFALLYHFTRSNLEYESISMMHGIASDPFQLAQFNESGTELRLPYFTIQLGSYGELIATGGGYYDLSNQEFLNELIARSMQTHRDTGVVEEYNLRFCRVISPKGVILVFADMSSENNTLKGLIQTSLIVGGFSFLVFLCISIFLSRWAVKPVAEAWQQQKKFVADASHELKTPLTVILTNAELLQSMEYDENTRRNFAKSILLMSRQMQNLLEKMLELAKSDAAQSGAQEQAVNFSKVVLDAAISFEGLFVEQGMALESDAEPNIIVQGSEQNLRQVVDILLDNARKYAFPGSETRLTLYRCGHSRCQLRIADPGPEIPREELTHIFQRFYRMDQARSRDGSFGLGLSIAESIVTQHKGRIWAESTRGINTFIVEFSCVSKA